MPSISFFQTKFAWGWEGNGLRWRRKERCRFGDNYYSRKFKKAL